MFLYYSLIYSKLVLCFFSFYAFLFFGLLADAKNAVLSFREVRCVVKNFLS